MAVGRRVCCAHRYIGAHGAPYKFNDLEYVIYEAVKPERATIPSRRVGGNRRGGPEDGVAKIEQQFIIEVDDRVGAIGVVG